MAAYLRLLRHRDLMTSADDQARVDGSGDDASGMGASDRSRDEQQQEARSYALRLLGRREYSLAELVARLEGKGYARPLAQQVGRQLQEDGYQSDSRFVEVFGRSRIARGVGPMLLRAELRGRGIDDELIDEAVTHPQSFWIDVAAQAVNRRFRGSARTRDDWAQQARYLARKGHSADLIYSVLGSQPG